ncbi:MAG TPA: class I SAM-dependent methyltransferase [Candidatus Lokiarchaeia archaeon]|nr:class I SAM-dependent methyltransferase [Candidatus Lokiarchaeia archaeon]
MDGEHDNGVNGSKKPSNLHRVIKFYEEHAKDYDSDYEEDNWRLYDDLTWYFLEPFIPLIEAGQGGTANAPIILDAGGGTGKWSIPLAKRGYHVVCVDISKPMLDQAREKAKTEEMEGTIEFKRLDIRNMPEIESDSCDLVLAVGDVISYALDEDMVVGELFRVCKPGGCCIASVDNTFTYLIMELKSERWELLDALLATRTTDYSSPHPVRTFLPADLQLLFERHGFVVEQIAGKPVITNTIAKRIRRLKLEGHYKELLELEKRFGADPAFVGHGGHLQIAGRKQGS